MKLHWTSFTARLGRLLALSLLCLPLLACGFQPRGQATDLSRVPNPLAITGVRAYSPLHRELRDQLAVAGLQLAPTVAESAAVLRILRRDSDSRVLSVNSRNKAVEYELEESAQFALYDANGRELLAPQTIRVLRILFRPSNAVLGSDREGTLLREDMRRELVSRLIQRLDRQY